MKRISLKTLMILITSTSEAIKLSSSGVYDNTKRQMAVEEAMEYLSEITVDGAIVSEGERSALEKILEDVTNKK